MRIKELNMNDKYEKTVDFINYAIKNDPRAQVTLLIKLGKATYLQHWLELKESDRRYEIIQIITSMLFIFLWVYSGADSTLNSRLYSF